MLQQLQNLHSRKLRTTLMVMRALQAKRLFSVCTNVEFHILLPAENADNAILYTGLG